LFGEFFALQTSRLSRQWVQSSRKTAI
jgi:hypothetical protein